MHARRGGILEKEAYLFSQLTNMQFYSFMQTPCMYWDLGSHFCLYISLGEGLWTVVSGEVYRILPVTIGNTVWGRNLRGQPMGLMCGTECTTLHHLTTQPGGALVVWSRRTIAKLQDRNSIPGAGNNNVLVIRSVWHTLVSSVCNASLHLIWTLESTIQPGSHKEITRVP